MFVHGQKVRLSILLIGLYTLLDLTKAGSIFSDSFLENGGGSNEPEFEENIRNVTVPSGREAVLSCVVSNLGKYKVGWIRAEDQTILTLDTKVVTHNSRVSVTHDGVQTWNLHLRQVQQKDRGCYMCQINTAIMRKQLGCIDVHVSPNIVDEETSSDLTVREGDNATLVCKATGHPVPKIIWKREDDGKILMRRGMRDMYKGHDNITGETLQFWRLDRRQMGTFLCIASNDVPPVAPLIKVPSQLLGAPLGTEVILDCNVESSPKAFIYWMKNRGEMLIDGLGLKNSTKYVIQETRNSYKVHMKLIIRNFGKKDVGIYNCMATNSLGKAEGSIRLHEIKTNSKGTSSAMENQVVTVPGYATPPMSTESRNSGNHHTNKEVLWPIYAESPGGAVIISHDTKKEIRTDGISTSSSSDGSAAAVTPSSSSYTSSLLILFLLNAILTQISPHTFTQNTKFSYCR